MTNIQRYAASFLSDDSLLEPGDIFRKLDGTLWYVDTNGDQRSLTSGGGSSPSGLAIYGDGSDGPLTLHDGDMWLPGFYTDVTIVAGATVTVDPSASSDPIFFCTGTFTILGTLNLAGADADGMTPGVGGAGDGNGDGAAGQNAGGGESAACNAGPNTPLGGAGGDGSSGSGGPVAGYSLVRVQGPSNALANLTAFQLYNASTGGSSGAGDGEFYGGGGGAGGYWAIIAARHIVHGPDNLYVLTGVAGGDGGDDGDGNTGNGDCGGGGGGGAAYWVTVSDTLTGDANIEGDGGAGGDGCGTGTDGQPGQDGFAIHILNTAA